MLREIIGSGWAEARVAPWPPASTSCDRRAAAAVEVVAAPAQWHRGAVVVSRDTSHSGMHGMSCITTGGEGLPLLSQVMVAGRLLLEPAASVAAASPYGATRTARGLRTAPVRPPIASASPAAAHRVHDGRWSARSAAEPPERRCCPASVRVCV